LGSCIPAKGGIEWQGTQLLPATWVEDGNLETGIQSYEMKQTSNTRLESGLRLPNSGYVVMVPIGAMARFGQYCIVLPEKDTVIAITSGIGDMGSVLNLIWDRLLPAMETSPLPASPTSNALLQTRLESFENCRHPIGSATSPIAATVSGKIYSLEPDSNDADAFQRNSI